MYIETLTINGKVEFTAYRGGKLPENETYKITPYCIQHGKGKQYFVLVSLGSKGNKIVCQKDDVIIRELKIIGKRKDGE